jgi:glycine/D-amino acid oxidase-like deaminating enzyme
MQMRRRELLTTLPAAGLLGCAKRASVVVPKAAELWPGRLAKPIISAERVTRVTVGLRPFRPQGFRVERETIAEKTVIHNYGHGGGGMTLSWGSAERAVDLLGPLPDRAAVVGCGVMGLSTARILQQRGVSVKIYTKATPPETTSNWSGAQWWPTSTHDGDKVSDEFRQGFIDVVKRAYRLMQNYVGERHGVEWRPNYFVSDEAFRDTTTLSPTGPLLETQPEFRDLGPGQHSLPWRHVRGFQSMMMEPNRYLRALLEEFFLAGGQLERRALNTLTETSEQTIFNCLGLGAREVAGDTTLVPIRGQLVVLLPQADLNYNLLAGGYYLFPRRDGVLLGGTFDRGVETLAADPEITKRILAGHSEVASKFNF